MEISELQKLKYSTSANISKLVKDEFLEFFHKTSIMPDIHIEIRPMYIAGKKEPVDFIINTDLSIKI